jgi:glycosyltransferase involved in cell wall biosynthesis
MRIAHCLNHSRKGNGHVAVAVDLACEQAKDHEVALLSASGDFDHTLRSAGVHILRINDFDRRELLRASLEMFSALRRFRPDVVNAHMPGSALAAWAARPILGFKLVTTIHNAFDRQAWLMGVGNRVIAVSDAVSEQMGKAGISPKKLRVVTNGTIGGARRSVSPKIAVPLKHPAIVTVCGLHDRKGVGDLIKAFDLVFQSRPAAHLYIVGEGPQRGEYERLAAGLPCHEHVHFLGFVEDPREVLASADIFTLASLQDPCPLVLCEARQMGNAIVATAVDGIPHALGGGRFGKLVPPSDPSAMAHAIKQLLADDVLRANFAAAAQEELHQIGVQLMSDRTVKIYEDAVRARGGRRERRTESSVVAGP